MFYMLYMYTYVHTYIHTYVHTYVYIYIYGTPPGTYLLPVLAVLYSETCTWWLLLGVANKQTCT